ncbi:hypothetical protein PIB30_000777 [Stylosanthes scabra]|uniref:Transmembrane protein n=1 Tax=Stylosanthes scabra TaxID=79078 RepID=A0ABU6Q257_9FABA|nr:hypothetical protein [Stylosanthes scabra]
MKFATGSPKDTWHPMVKADTTTLTYWLNWRVYLCSICLLVPAIFSIVLIWKYESFRKPARNGSLESQKEKEEEEEEVSQTLYEDETWRPCLRGIHPAWLLAFRILAFSVLSVFLIFNASKQGGKIFYFYTDWTLASITFYFGLGSLLSLHGCYQHQKKASGDKVEVEIDIDIVGSDSPDLEQGTYHDPPLPLSSITSNQDKDLGFQEKNEHLVRQPAGACGYIFQIIFQMNAGAVMLTDCVFWFVIFPFLTKKNHNIDFIIITTHTINAVFLLTETALNCLRFPWFRIGYFGLWTFSYVVFQWLVHGFVKLWWPYPVLDVSSPFAPLWYLSVTILHIPCYGIMALIMKMKHTLLSAWYPDSYLCVK